MKEHGEKGEHIPWKLEARDVPPTQQQTQPGAKQDMPGQAGTGGGQLCPSAVCLVVAGGAALVVQQHYPEAGLGLKLP